MNKKRCICVVPARKGSKGISGKNLKLFNGKPLLYWTLKVAKESNLFEKIIVTSDWCEVKKFVKKLNWKNVEFIKRPEEISRDNSSAVEYVDHCLSTLDPGVNFDVFLLQPTSPLRTKNDLVVSYRIFKTQNAKSLVSVVKVPHNFLPSSLMVLTNENQTIRHVVKEPIFDRHNKTSDYFARNGASIYIFDAKFFFETGTIIQNPSAFYEMPMTRSIDIDTIEEFEIAEALHLQLKSH